MLHARSYPPDASVQEKKKGVALLAPGQDLRVLTRPGSLRASSSGVDPDGLVDGPLQTIPAVVTDPALAQGVDLSGDQSDHDPVVAQILGEGDGLLVLTLRKPYANGTTDFLFSEVELAQRLAALVPPARKNSVSYHGVLAPRHRFRNQVIPERDVRPNRGGRGVPGHGDGGEPRAEVLRTVHRGCGVW